MNSLRKDIEQIIIDSKSYGESIESSKVTTSKIMKAIKKHNYRECVTLPGYYAP